jgi:hypothetical protein
MTCNVYCFANKSHAYAEAKSTKDHHIPPTILAEPNNNNNNNNKAFNPK